MRVVLFMILLLGNGAISAQICYKKIPDTTPVVHKPIVGCRFGGVRVKPFDPKQETPEYRCGMILRANRSTVPKPACDSRIIPETGPLYVIDGELFRLEKDMNSVAGRNIDPATIDSITLLNEPAGAALYGSAGMNGVIIITTKLTTKTLQEVVVISPTTIRCRRIIVCRSFSARRKTKDSVVETPKVSLTALKIFPNPVSKGGNISISDLPLQQKELTLQVLDAGGRLIRQERSNMNKSVQSISVDAKWSTGLYYIRVINEDGKQLSQGRFLVQ